MDATLERIRKRREEEDEEMIFLVFPALHFHLMDSTGHRERQKRHNSILYGKRHVQYLLNGHLKNCLVAYRMEPHIFRALASYLINEGLITDSRIKVEEKLAFFLYMLSHNASYEDLQQEFQHSGQTFHKYIKDFFNIIPTLTIRFVRPLNMEEPHPRIATDHRLFPYFENYIGAIDGTHVPVIISPHQAAPFRNRKGTLSQNVMIACDFDLNITFMQKRMPEQSNQRMPEQSNQRMPVASSRKYNQKEVKKNSPKKNNGDGLVGVMERFVNIKEKQANEEKQVAQDFTITRCINVLKTVEGVTQIEKIKSFDVFKVAENREIFVNAAADQDGTALMWLQSQIAKLT